MKVYSLNTIYRNGVFSQYLLLLLIPLGVIGETFAILVALCTYRWCKLIPACTVGILLFTHYLLTGIWYEYPVLKTLQQIFLIMLYFTAYSTIFKWRVPSIEAIWTKYLRVCYFFAILAWLQLFIYWMTGVDVFLWPGRAFTGSGLFLRVHSYFEEPACYAAFLTPYIAYFLLNFEQIKQNRYRFLMVFLSYLLTFSSIGIVCVFLIIMYKLYNSRYKVLLLALFAIPIIFISVNVLESNDKFENGQSPTEQSIAKISETITAFSNLSPGEFELLNPSTYATVSNLWVAVNAPNRLFGNGIGSHVHSYETIYTSDYILYGLNKSDAYSLFTRIFSEFGVVGLLLLIYILIAFKNSHSSVNIASMFFIIACLIRGGHYTFNGVFLFLFIFVLSSGKLKWQFKEVESNNSR